MALLILGVGLLSEFVFQCGVFIWFGDFLRGTGFFFLAVVLFLMLASI